MKIGVLLGGFSSEREISLKSGKAVAEALRTLNHEVIELDVRDDRASVLENVSIDVAFVAMHGKFGEDGGLQTILERKGIPYTGSGPAACRLTMDKLASKKRFVEKGIPTPPWKMFNVNAPVEDLMAIVEMLGYPVVMKPPLEGSSIGVSIHQGGQTLSEGIEQARPYGSEVLIEKFIKGDELTVGILVDEPLPVIRLKPHRTFYDYAAKYQDTRTEYIVNPPMRGDLTQLVQQTALKAHQALGCSGISRVDIMLSQRGEPFVLEANAIPGLTERSLVPKAAAAKGIPFPQLCQKIIDLALSPKT